MPELPEVETIARGLRKMIVSQKITAIEMLNAKSFDVGGYDVDSQLIGHRIIAVRRRAKLLMIDLSNRFSLVIHLKMTGQLVVVSSSTRFGGGHPTDSLIGQLPDRSTRIILTLDKGNRLFFNDQRKFGWMKLLPTSQIEAATMLGRVGPEPLSKFLNDAQFITRVRQKAGTNIKAVLLDQQVIAGIGNIYADESLFLARINPRAKVSDLTNKKLVQLLVAIRQALKLAIDKGGSTDRTYRQADGSAGSYLSFAQVFRRQNQPCPHCYRPIKKIRVAGRGTHYCSYCQRMPKARKQMV